VNVDFEDLNDLEKELNDLSLNENDFIRQGGSSNSRQGLFESDLFSSGNNFDNDDRKISFDEINIKLNDDDDNEASHPSIGKSTAQFNDDGVSWDGYQKFNNIPINPDKNIQSQPQMSKEELLREKFKYLRKLEALERKGVELSKKYNMDSSLAEMQGEYETIMEEKNKSNSIKFQGNMMLAIINGIEFLNNRFDPFDIKLDGFSDQITENITDYDEVFGELYEKYKSKASISPELKLLFQLGGSAMMVHMTNTMFKSSMPNMDDIFKQNPDLMRSFQQAAVNSMATSSPGLSNFMDGVLNDTSRRGPPPPVQTQYNQPDRFAPEASNYANRGGNNPYGQFSSSNSFREDGIRINENRTQSQSQPQSQNTPLMQSKRVTRTEMKGPSDINEILGKLKTKTVNIHDQPNLSTTDGFSSYTKPIQTPQYNPNQFNDIESEYNTANYTNNSSTISSSDLKELSGNVKLPKKSNRKKSGGEKMISSMNIDL
jgi:hypothetical protein